MTDENRKELEAEETSPQTEIQRRVEASIDRAIRAGSLLKSGLEFFGRHPLITGVLGVLGIVGLVLSIQSYSVDRSEARETTSQIEKLQQGVTTVEERISAVCSSPPCWSLSQVMRADTIGRPKDLLDSKLPIAEFVRDNQYQYIVEGCRVYVEYRTGVVSYVSADLYRIERASEGKFYRFSCPFEIPRILHSGSYHDIANQNKYSKSNHPTFPINNVNVKVQDLFGLYGNDVRISNACINCGNYADPYAEIFVPGAHAGNFIDIYFYIHSLRFQDESSYGQWKKMKLNLVSLGPTPEDTWNVKTTDHCNKNVYSAMLPLSEFGVERVGVGRGQRNWGGPPVLFCQR